MELDLSDMIRIFKRWKWLFLITVVLVTAATVGIYKILPKKYEISAVVKVEGTKVSSLSFGGFSFPVGGEGNVDDYIEIMKSRSIVESVINEKNILNKIIKDKDLKKLKKLGYTKEDLLELAYRNVRKNLEVSTLGKSALISVKYKSKDPKLGYEMVSGLIDKFKEKIESMRSQSAEKKIEFLTEKRKQTYDEFRKKLSKLIEFQKKNDVVSLENELLNLKSMEYKIKTTLSASKVAVSKLNAENYELLEELKEMPAFKDPQMMGYLNKELSDLESQLSALRAVYPEDYIEIKKTKAQIEDLKSKIESLRKSLASNPIGFYDIEKMILENSLKLKDSDIRIAAAEKILRDLKERINKMIDLESEFTAIKSDIDVYKNLLSFIWQQQIQVMLSEISSVHPVTVISPPKYTDIPKEVSKVFLGAVGLSMGIFLGVLAVFWKESSYKNVADHIIFARMNDISDYYTIRKGELDKDVERIVADLRNYTGKLLVCGPSEGEGKSSISLKIAEKLSSIGRNVLLVDGDFEKKDLSRRFGISEPSARLIRIGRIQFLSLSDWKELSNVDSSFDITVVDSPSYERRIIDLLNLVDASDSSLLVITEMKSDKSLSEELYRKLQGKLFGVVFNKVRWLS